MIKNLFTPWKLGSIKSVDTFYWYLSQLIVLLKPDFNYSSSFPLPWVNKVTTGTLRFASVIENVAGWVTLLANIKHFLARFRSRFHNLLKSFQ